MRANLGVMMGMVTGTAAWTGVEAISRARRHMHRGDRSKLYTITDARPPAVHLPPPSPPVLYVKRPRPALLGRRLVKKQSEKYEEAG
jgi:hypothetical protein